MVFSGIAGGGMLSATNRQIDFLDVHIDATSEDEYKTSVYQKPTSSGVYLNANSECPDRYKTGTIKALVHRTYKISSSWQLFHERIAVLRQTFINNGYSNTTFDQVLNNYLQSRDKKKSDDTENIYNIYYRNQYSSAYKTDERILKDIIHNNITIKKENTRIKLNIYYKSSTTASLVMKNSPDKPKNDLKKTSVIYDYKCTKGDCELLPEARYIGMTTTTLSRRLTMHLQSGAIKQHSVEVHNERLTRQDLVENTKIAKHFTDFATLQIHEAIMILRQAPTLNKQNTGVGRTLLLLGDKNQSE